MGYKSWSIAAVVLSILIAIVSASLDAGEQKQRIDQLQSNDDQQDDRLLDCEKDSADRDVTLGKIEKDVEYMRIAVDEIRADLKELQHENGG